MHGTDEDKRHIADIEFDAEIRLHLIGETAAYQIDELGKVLQDEENGKLLPDLKHLVEAYNAILIAVEKYDNRA